VYSGIHGCSLRQKRLRLSWKVDECKPLTYGTSTADKASGGSPASLAVSNVEWVVSTAPAVFSRDVTLAEGATVVIQLDGADADGDAVDVVITRPPQPAHGRTVQVDPIKFMLKAPGSKRLKLNCDALLSTSAFKLNVRHYSTACWCTRPAGWSCPRTRGCR
jgi:hypothetical protein